MGKNKPSRAKNLKLKTSHIGKFYNITPFGSFPSYIWTRDEQKIGPQLGIFPISGHFWPKIWLGLGWGLKIFKNWGQGWGWGCKIKKDCG